MSIEITSPLNGNYQAGTGTGTYTPSGVLTVMSSSVGTAADTNETDLWSYTVPANTLNANGKTLRVTATITYAATATTKTSKIYFGAAFRTLNPSTSAPNALLHTVTFNVMRTGASAQLFYPASNVIGSSVQAVNTTTAAEATSGAIILKITGQNGTANLNDILLTSVMLEAL